MAEAGKHALIIANANYEDTVLRQLVAPAQDAKSLSEVLADPTICGFQVTTLLDAPAYRICDEAEAFFVERQRDDLCLLYFSGHGVTDEDGLLYFAASNTRHRRLRSTAVAAAWVNDLMTECRSRRQVLLLDCCHSGAFARTKAGTSCAILKATRMTTITPVLTPLYTREAIQERVRAIGQQIDQDFAGQRIVLIGVLKGAAIFLADLARNINVDCTFDFVAVSSYGKGTTSSGQVKLIKDLDQSIEDRNVIVVEDILDTGLTLRFLKRVFEQHHPRALKVAALLDKPSRRLEPIEADYVGFSIPNQFVVGYGMDYAERYRNLPDVCLFDEGASSHGK